MLTEGRRGIIEKKTAFGKRYRKPRALSLSISFAGGAGWGVAGRPLHRGSDRPLEDCGLPVFASKF